MRICGKAKAVDIRFDGVLHHIEVGCAFVSEIVVHVEGSLVHTIVTFNSEPNAPSSPEIRTALSSEVHILWAEKPNIQSLSEWMMWLSTNVVSNVCNRRPQDVGPKPALVVDSPALKVMTSSPASVDPDAGGPEGFCRS